MISAVALSPALDVTYVVSELRGIQRPAEVRRVAGGKALNAARAATLLGVPVLVVAVLGGGTGEVVRSGARADGVELDVVDSTRLTRTCVSLSSLETGELTEVYEHATPVDADVFAELLDRVARQASARPGWWLVSGAVPGSLGEGALAQLVGVLHGAGAQVALDSHGPALRAAVQAGLPALLKVNRAEAAELVGLPVTSTLATLLAAVHELTGGLVVLTDGTAGSLATDGRLRVRARTDGFVGRFPVGSGDSFLGGLLVALDRGDDLTGALRLATAAASANAQVPGAGTFDLATVEAIAQAVQITYE